MKFSKEVMQELAFDNAPEEFEVVLNKICETSRWSISYDLIFKHEGKFYSSGYSRGATEQQDEGPYEYDEDEIEVTEVEPYESTITKYRAVKEE